MEGLLGHALSLESPAASMDSHLPAPALPRRPAEEWGGTAATATGNCLRLVSRIQPGAAQVQPHLCQQTWPHAPVGDGHHVSSPWWRGGPTKDCSGPSEELPPRPTCWASSEPIQPAPANGQPRDTSTGRGATGWRGRVAVGFGVQFVVFFSLFCLDGAGGGGSRLRPGFLLSLNSVLGRVPIPVLPVLSVLSLST